MKKLLIYFSILAMVLSLSEITPAQTRSSGGPLSPLQQAFNVHYYDLNLRVAMDQQAISGHVDLYIIPDADTLTTIELDLVEEYRISYVETGGRLTGYRRSGDKLFVYLTNPPAAGQSFRIRVVYSGKPPWLYVRHGTVASTGRKPLMAATGLAYPARERGRSSGTRMWIIPHAGPTVPV
jgi:hypothetical protein